jgi:DNA-binding protein HU-beta
MYRMETPGQVIKSDIVNEVSSAVGMTKVQAAQAIEAILGAFMDAMASGGRIEIRGFGVFVVKPRKLGIGRNPRTGLVVPIPPGRTVRFRPGKDLHNTAAAPVRTLLYVDRFTPRSDGRRGTCLDPRALLR